MMLAMMVRLMEENTVNSSLKYIFLPDETIKLQVATFILDMTKLPPADHLPVFKQIKHLSDSMALKLLCCATKELLIWRHHTISS